MVTAVPDMKVMAASFQIGCDAYLRSPSTMESYYDI